MIVVGLTGGIGSGKSTVAGMFQKLGVPVYDSDKEAKKLMLSSKKIKKELISLFGKNAFEDEKLNRKYISSIVFNDKEMLDKLNEIVHPEVRKHFITWVKRQKTAYVVQESALIFENNNEAFYDRTITVTAPLNDRIDRVMARDGLSDENVVQRMQNQLPDSEKIRLSDYIIENLDLRETEKKVHALHNVLLAYS